MRKKIFKLFFWLFGLNPIKIGGDKKGTIIILIDGLSYDAFQFAIQKRFCPTLKKLSNTSHTLKNYYCGLPAATTATEALLFYGNNDNIPGFTWYDRKLKKIVRGNRSLELTEFEDAFEKKRNLFKNGSVIMGVYSGGATELSMSGRNLSFSRSVYFLKTAHYFLVALLYPVQLIRTLYLVCKTILFYKHSHANSVKDTFSKIILGQFSCFLTEIEIMRNTEKIFVDFLLYDEYAHEYGPTNHATLSSLRLIDRYIKRIVQSVKKSERSYDIILLSDHGQTDSIPFDFPIIRSIPDIKKSLLNELYSVVETYGSPQPTEGKKELYVVPAGSTLQLYFSNSLTKGLLESEINTEFPHFISNLLSWEEFGWVLVRRNENSSIIYGKKGSVILHSNKTYEVKDTPFPNCEASEMKHIIASFHAYSTFTNNGDLVIFGNVSKNHKVYSFEKHLGTHGGFYGPMTKPFIMTSNPNIKGDSMASLFDTIAILL